LTPAAYYAIIEPYTGAKVDGSTELEVLAGRRPGRCARSLAGSQIVRGAIVNNRKSALKADPIPWLLEPDGSTELAEVFAQGRAQDRPHRTNGSVIYGLFEPVGEEERALLKGETQRLEGFLGGEFLPPRTYTPFTRALK
jgi:hypothetical protein